MERLKVLISAYACEPGKGSEPEVGWQWALQMARFHEVTVLTRANNEAAIAAALRRVPVAESPRFVYFDLRPPFLWLKRRGSLHQTYYALWQRTARHVIRRLLKAERFDLLHHVTYAGARYATAVPGHGVPSIFGPVGGLESIPWALLPWRYPLALAQELARNAANAWQARGPALRRKATAASLVIASTTETQRVLSRFGVESRLLPTIGLHFSEFPERASPPAPVEHPLRLLFAGRMLYWKGVELALRALHETSSGATLTLIGDGEFLPAARRLAEELGLRDRVEFRGRLSREETLRAYADFDAFLYPSLHDSGGFTLLEAMANGLPAICLDCGGPGLSVDASCGIRVPLGSRAAVIEGLADAINTYARAPQLRREHGGKARARIAAEYDWARKAEAMHRIYLEVARP